MKEGKKDFLIEEEDGIVVYDESDDYDPGEDEIPEDNEFHLPTNEEVFTDEYMQEYAILHGMPRMRNL